MERTVEGLTYARSGRRARGKLSSSERYLRLENPLLQPLAMFFSPQPSPPTSPSFIGTNEHQRRPSLAPSADSAGSWEGALDIYDDYRYSRFPTASKMLMSSRFSVNAASVVTRTPPIPEPRPSTDSRPRVDSKLLRGGDSFRSRTDSARSRQHSPYPLP